MSDRERVCVDMYVHVCICVRLCVRVCIVDVEGEAHADDSLVVVVCQRARESECVCVSFLCVFCGLRRRDARRTSLVLRLCCNVCIRMYIHIHTYIRMSKHMYTRLVLRHGVRVGTSKGTSKT